MYQVGVVTWQSGMLYLLPSEQLLALRSYTEDLACYLHIFVAAYLECLSNSLMRLLRRSPSFGTGFDTLECATDFVLGPVRCFARSTLSNGRRQCDTKSSMLRAVCGKLSVAMYIRFCSSLYSRGASNISSYLTRLKVA